MNVTKRAFIFGLALTFGGRSAFAGRPTTFDFYEYVRKLKEASDKPDEEPWISAKVRNIDRVNRQIRITHVPAPSVGMPAMTMTLGIVEGLDISAPRGGDVIDIKVGKRDGDLVVTEFVRRIRVDPYDARRGIRINAYAPVGSGRTT